VIRSIRTAAAALLLAACAASAQAPVKILRVGLVANTVPLDEWRSPRRADGSPHAGELIRQGLRERGWVDGKNVRILHRSAEGRLEGLPAIFEELAALPVDVIVAIGPGAVAAAKATKTVPIVMSATAAAVDIGLASSLARPGGNLTGLSFEARDEIIAKRLELLKRALPQLSKVAFLTHGPPGASWDRMYQAAATQAGVNIVRAEFADLADLERAFASAERDGAQAVLVVDGVSVHQSDYQRAINAAASRRRLPTLHSAEGGADTGGLMSYAIDSRAQYRRIPYFVDRILRGAKPSDLPMEQPGNPELVVNRGVAKAFGLVLPLSLVLQANRVIE
jgi:putative tryptophan/tyrosine transport system substrate-binding protein